MHACVVGGRLLMKLLNPGKVSAGLGRPTNHQTPHAGAVLEPQALGVRLCRELIYLRRFA
jgi:hypothetical protein